MGTLRAKASETQIAVDAVVDSICNDFESTWRSGHHPRIEDFLGRAAEGERERLLLELVLVEFDLRRGGGDSPTIEEYLRRFPEHASVLKNHLLRELETAGRSNVFVLDVDDRELRQGDFWGRYQLLALLGRGGFGEVWRARDPVLQRDVALKMLRSDKPISQELNQDLVREGQRVAQLDHEHIVRVLHAEIVNGRAVLVSDLKEGGTLLSRLQDGSTIDRETAVQWMIDVALALQSAHEKRIVHRDLKPGNLLFDRKGNIYVADFGLAVSEIDQLSEPSGMMGTWAYTSPEQARGDARLADPRSDLYSLGVIFYQLLTGQLPYVPQADGQYKQQILEREPRPPRSRNREIPIELETICLACLRKEIANRPGSAQEVADQLQAWLNSRQIAAPERLTPAIPVPTRQAQFRQPVTTWIVLTTIGFALVAASIVGPLRIRRQDPAVANADETQRPLWATPRVVVWNPFDAAVDPKGYEDDANRYRFYTNGESLFEVGQCTADFLTLTSTLFIHGPERLGRAGVFWAWEPLTGDDYVASCCWGIEVGRTSVEFGDSILIRQYDIGPGGTGGQHYVRDSDTIHVVALDHSLTARFDLRAEVTDTQVIQIHLNGQPVLTEPVELKSQRMRTWRRLNGSGYGFLGKSGTVSVETFSAD